MIRQHVTQASASGRRTLRRLTGAAVVLALGTPLLPAQAASANRAPHTRMSKTRPARAARLARAQRRAAAALSAADHHDGNGHHNRNIVSTRSPTHNHGFQHTNNSNAGGLNDTQNALCGHTTVCNVTQKVIIVRPAPPAPPAPPVGQDVGVRPELAPGSPRDHQPRPPEPGVDTGAFLYLGPYGLSDAARHDTAVRRGAGDGHAVMPFGMFG